MKKCSPESWTGSSLWERAGLAVCTSWHGMRVVMSEECVYKDEKIYKTGKSPSSAWLHRLISTFPQWELTGSPNSNSFLPTLLLLLDISSSRCCSSSTFGSNNMQQTFNPSDPAMSHQPYKPSDIPPLSTLGQTKYLLSTNVYGNWRVPS